MNEKIIRLNLIPGICLCCILVSVYQLGRKSAFNTAINMIDMFDKGYNLRHSVESFETLIDNKKES